MKSLDQDIIYKVTQEKHKTAKQIQGGVFVKRKTGSRLLIECINQLGHMISKHEVNSLEIGFSEKQTEYQLVRAYIRPAV